MAKPTLIIMAGGMGSRYGGLKQIDPVGPNGEIIIDYSIYDAKQAGFERIVFLINKGIHADFDEVIGRRISKYIQTDYAFQEINSLLPANFVIPEGRVKPWGTGQAILCCESKIDGPFAVINADDFYGRHSFQLMSDFLQKSDNQGLNFSMVSYQLENTLTENGHVARGVCQTENNWLTGIIERTMIVKTPDGASYSDNDGATFTPLPKDSVVSMNFWGFTTGLFDELRTRFSAFLENVVPQNPLKSEIYIPNVVGELIAENKAAVEVMRSADHWYGVTYREDKPSVEAAIADMIARGAYPAKLWE